MNNILEIAKKRIDQRLESKSKEFALSVYFENISSFINYYTGEAKESKASLGTIPDLYLSNVKNRLFDCVSVSELDELLKDCTKAKNDFFNEISNLYEKQYKKEFNFFSFKEQTNFDWSEKIEAVTNIKYYLVYKELCGEINGKLNPSKQPETVKPDEVYKTQNLFKVGLLFANGEMNKYYTVNKLNEFVPKDGLSPLKIAKQLGNSSFEKYILASKNNYKTGENKSKNIFNNLDMMKNIIEHCKAEKIEIDPYFMSRLPIE